MKLLIFLLFLFPAFLFTQMESEPNGSFGSADLIELNTPFNAYLESAQDADFFKFNLIEAGIIEISVRNVPAGISFNVSVYQPNQADRIFYRVNTQEGAALNIELSNCETGLHYFSLEENDNDFNTAEAYQVTINFTPFSSIDECECENETVGQSCRIEPNQIINATFSPWYSSVLNSARFDFDNYKVEVSEPSIMRFSMITVPSNLDIYTEVFGSDQSTRLIESRGSLGQGYTFDISVCELGDYYFSMRDFRDIGGTDFNADEGYSFRIDLIPFAGIDDCECSNENLVQACEVSDGETVSALLAPRFNYELGIKDKDAYFIEVEEPSVLSYALTSVPDNLDLQLEIYAPDQITRLLDRGTGDSFQTDLTICEPGKYYFTIEDQTIFNNRFNANEPYIFSVNLTSLADIDVWECNNNSIDEATQIGICDTVRAIIGPPNTYESSAADEDFFAIELTGDVPYRVLLTNSPDDLDLRVYVYDANGSELQSFLPDNSSGVVNDFFTPPSTGTFYMRVFDPNRRYDVEKQYQFLVGCNQTTSNVEAEPLSATNLYPNPVTSLLTIDLTGFNISSNASLDILDIQGRIVIKQKIPSSVHSLDLSRVAVGTYLVRVTDENKQYTGRIVRK